MTPVDPLKTAKQCRHYAMCKIDFLGTGLCPSGEDKHYVSYFPQGRMDIFAALAENRIPVTERLVDIAETCTLCGICDTQCYFVTELRPLEVMRALKESVEIHLAQGKPIEKPQSDQVLTELQGIVGEEWASGDPAILVSYAHDPGPFTGIQLPRYVALPGSSDEVSRTVKFCMNHAISYAVRGNGSSVMGFVFAEEGLVMDLRRMRDIRIDTVNWKASVGPGVAAFELQTKAAQENLRANVAEPAALVCANIMCSGIFSTYSNAYGTAADNYVNAEFVGPDGHIFDLQQREAPNLYGFEPVERPVPGICTRVDVRLHPKTGDEEGLLVPFADFEKAAALARELSQRRIGVALAVLGLEYVATFVSPTAELARKVKAAFREDLGIEYGVLMIGDRYARKSVMDMADVYLDQELLRSLILGLPGMVEEDWLSLVRGGEGAARPYETLLRKEMLPLLQTSLKPSPGAFAAAVPEDLHDFYQDLYGRPEMTDLVWLNDFRIISSRMGREKHVVAFIVYVPLDRIEVIEDLNAAFRRIAEERDLKNDFGFFTPLDMGKRAVLEYDYYMDQTDPEEIQRMQEAVMAAGDMIEGFSREVTGVRWIKYVFNQGFARKESFLYT